jgi:hypothetical protein
VTEGPFLARARLAIGVACVGFAAVLFALHLPSAIRSMNTTVQGYAPLHTAQDRLLTSGAIQGVPRDLQSEALALIPPRSDYAVLLPASVDAAAAYGINSTTYATAVPFLRYLLLPSWPVDAPRARYVICFGCNTAPWDGRTTWLWTDGHGSSIGKVRGR